jgi:phosphosulfolactate phosphohydrolase-like enzyme
MIEERQEVTERCHKMTLYLSIENWLCAENIKHTVSEVPQHNEEIKIFTLYFDIVHSAQSDMVCTVTNHLYVQSICKNIQCVYKQLVF